MNNDNLYEFYKEYIYNDNQLEEPISELPKLHDLIKLEASLDYHNISL